jgi:hypothetical protein
LPALYQSCLKADVVQSLSAMSRLSRTAAFAKRTKFSPRGCCRSLTRLAAKLTTDGSNQHEAEQDGKQQAASSAVVQISCAGP